MVVVNIANTDFEQTIESSATCYTMYSRMQVGGVPLQFPDD